MQDLWAGLNGETPLKQEHGRGGGSRQHRLTEQAVVAALRVWLLQEYVVPYGTSLGANRIFKRCYWVDGLGISRQSIAASAQQLAHLARPIALHSFVLDSKRGKQKPPGGEDERQPETAQNGALAKEGGLLHASWPELAPDLLAVLEQSAAIFLLDPLKERLFRYSDLLPLYQRTAPTELLLWLSHKQIEMQLLPRLQDSEGAAELTNLLHGDRWKSLLIGKAQREQPEKVINGLVDLFVESMRPHFLSVQRLTFPVHTGPALVEAAPYSLLFATRRQDSLTCLNDALCHRIQRLLAESQQGTLTEDWFKRQREEQTAERKASLAQEILMVGRAQRARRWPDLRQQLLLAHFGQFTLQEYDCVIADLLARGEVSCEWRKRNQEISIASLPGNDDLLVFTPASKRREKRSKL
jgi:hypothetical protein